MHRIEFRASKCRSLLLSILICMCVFVNIYNNKDQVNQKQIATRVYYSLDCYRA